MQFRVGLGIHGHFEQRVEQVVEELLEVLKELVDAVDIAVQRFNKFSFASRFLKIDKVIVYCWFLKSNGFHRFCITMKMVRYIKDNAASMRGIKINCSGLLCDVETRD